MKPANTCLVLGAGASKPYGYPLGAELAKSVIDLGKKGRDYWAKVENLPKVKASAKSVAEKFEQRRGQDPQMTIDQFLEQEYKARKTNERQRDEYETGMMLITDVIRQCEHPEGEIIDWYQLLFEHLERSVNEEF